MKAMVLAGIFLVVAGILVFAYPDVTYTTRESVLEVGPLKATIEKEHGVALPKTVGGLAVGVGVLLLAFGTRNRWLSKG